MTPLSWPILRSRLAWRTVWRLYIWLTCDCRRFGTVSWHGDVQGGWRCDSCGRRQREPEATP